MMTPLLQLWSRIVISSTTAFDVNGGGLYFRLDIILIKGISKHTLNMYFSGLKIDPKYTFLHVFFLICPSCPFQNLSIWPKTHLKKKKFAHICTPKRCTRVHCLVLKKNYLRGWYSTSNTSGPPPPTRGRETSLSPPLWHIAFLCISRISK